MANKYAAREDQLLTRAHGVITQGQVLWNSWGGTGGTPRRRQPAGTDWKYGIVGELTLSPNMVRLKLEGGTLTE